METESQFYAVKYESNTSPSSIEGFDQICRCCLSAENKLCSIFDIQCSEKSFFELLHSYTSVYVSI